MNIFERAYRAIVAYLTAPSAEAVEREVLVAVVPVAETALNAAAAVSPVAAEAVALLEPIVNKEIGK